MHTTNGTNTHNGHEYVDLGLPSGTLWATCNVGATSPEQAGLYFAWGETTGYTAEQVPGVKAFTDESYKASAISADLTLAQDVAHSYMGGMWRMPTITEFQELANNCNVVWTENYNGTGVAGRVFTSKINGNSVFFPASGRCNLSSVYGVNWYGLYWSASWDSSDSACYLYFDYRHLELFNGGRYFGQPVRGVCKR